MAKKTSAQVAELLRELTIKVRNGVLSSAEAEKHAIQALQEVEETPQEDTETPQQAAPEPAPSGGGSAVDPKTRLLSLLTKLEESIQSQIKKFEKDISDLLKETAGAAVPIGDFSIGSDISSAKLTVESGEKPAQAKVSYMLKRDWTVDGIQMPVTANLKPRACNIPLRQDVLSLCTDIRENTSSELAWKKGKKLPLERVAALELIAHETGDYRVSEILAERPSDALAENWKKWAVAGQVYLMGTDFSEGRGFNAIKSGL